MYYETLHTSLYEETEENKSLKNVEDSNVEEN